MKLETLLQSQWASNVDTVWPDPHHPVVCHPKNSPEAVALAAMVARLPEIVRLLRELETFKIRPENPNVDTTYLRQSARNLLASMGLV